MANYDASIRVKTEIVNDKAMIDLRTLENRMEKVRQKTEALVKKKKELEAFTIKTAEYEVLEKQLVDATSKFDELLNKQKEWQALGFENKGTAWDALIREQDEASKNIDEIKAKMKQLEQTGKAFANQVGTDAYKKVCDDLNNASNETELLKMKTDLLNKQFDSAAKSSKKCFGVFQQGTKKTNGMFATMGTRLKGIALSLLVFNWISKGFNAMVSAMQKGFQNLAQYSKEYNKVMSDMKSQSATLKNSLATAFEPIITTIVPYITQLISWLNTAMNYIAQFWAVLSGKNTYTRAKNQVVDYAKSLKDAGKSAQGTLASFDEINVLNKDNGSSAAGGEVTGANAFEEVEIDLEKFKWVDWLRDNLETILGLVELIGFGFLAWKLDSALLSNMDKIVGFFGSTAFKIGTLIAGILLLISGFKDMMENGINLKNSLMVIAGTFLTVSAIAGAAVGGIAALVTGLVLAIVADWENFKRDVITPLWDWLQALLSNTKETIEGVKRIFRGIITFIKGAFTGDWKKAWEGIKDIFAGVWQAITGTVKLVVNTIIGIINTMVNALAGAINAVIRAINSMSFTVPDWVPFFGGETYQGFNIPTLPAPANIPYLEYGGTVTQETYAKISEGNRKEVVLPLEQHTEWADLLAEKIGGGTTVIRFEGSLAELGRILKPVIDTENSRVGRSLVQI